MSAGLWSAAAAPVLVMVLTVASVADVAGGQRIPHWLTLGAIFVGIGTAALSGSAALHASAAGTLVGGLLLLPLALAGGFGGADVLLLAAVGAWHGWHFALVAACWAALAGGALAVVGWARGRRTLAYAPAIMTGALIALCSS